MVEIISVNSKKEQKAFIKFPFSIYKDFPNWVAPLNKDMWDWTKKSHPFYEYGTMEWFLAMRDGEVVGRIAAATNKRYNEHNKENTGFFGFFECIDDQEVANALFDKAFEKIKAWGFDKIQGPSSPSSNYDFGLLVDGFDDPPRIMMTYNPPYYEKLFEGYKMGEAKTLLAYKMDRDTVLNNEKLKRGVELVKKRSGMTIRKLNKKDIPGEVRLIKEIYNHAWEPNWGHVPFTEREIDKLADDFKLLVDPDFILFGEIDGKVVGMALALPDYNEKIIKFNGKLFPFNFLKLMFGKNYKWLRVVLLGVLPEYQRKGLDAAFYYQLIENGMKRGIEFGDGSWILEDNEMMNRGMKLASAYVYKKWKIYETAL